MGSKNSSQESISCANGRPPNSSAIYSALTRAANAPHIMIAFTLSAVNGVGAAAIAPPVELTRGACKRKDKGRTRELSKHLIDMHRASGMCVYEHTHTTSWTETLKKM